jgi:acyl-CoA thioester hydrolase
VVFRGPAPLARVRPEWVDGYGHMNMGFYLVAFDGQTDRLWPLIGLGPGLREAASAPSPRKPGSTTSAR